MQQNPLGLICPDPLSDAHVLDIDTLSFGICSLVSRAVGTCGPYWPGCMLHAACGQTQIVSMWYSLLVLSIIPSQASGCLLTAVCRLSQLLAVPKEYCAVLIVHFLSGNSDQMMQIYKERGF